MSLFSGVFRDRLKLSTGKSIFKNSDRLVTLNYRPISLLTSFSKVFENLIYARLYKHVCTNNILFNEQY